MPFPTFVMEQCHKLKHDNTPSTASNLRRLYVNLLLTGDLMRDLFTGKGRDVSPLDGKILTLLC